MKGRSFVFTGVQQPFEARDFPLPDVEPDAVLVRVAVANICGSDLHGWHGRTPRSGPTVMGHEMTGRVEKLGARVTADAAGAPLREGDRIVYSYFYPCRRCDPCRAGDPHHCVARRIGAGRAPSDAPPHFTGAYADYYYLQPGHYVLRAPDALDDLTLAPLNCALAQVIYGLHQAGFQPGETIPFNPAWLVHLNRRMIGVGGYQAWALRRGLELLLRTHDRYPYRAIMSHRYPLEQINEAFANADQGKAVRTALICADGVRL